MHVQLPQLRRSIPARAGKPEAKGRIKGTLSDHPPVSGGSRGWGWGRPAHPQGPSPRARGSPRVRWASTFFKGTIPARAGKPEAKGRIKGTLSDHTPHARGWSRHGADLAARRPGFPPRARGKRSRIDDLYLRRGSIPAHVGIDPGQTSGRGPRTPYAREGMGRTPRTTGLRIRGCTVHPLGGAISRAPGSEHAERDSPHRHEAIRKPPQTGLDEADFSDTRPTARWSLPAALHDR